MSSVSFHIYFTKFSNLHSEWIRETIMIFRVKLMSTESLILGQLHRGASNLTQPAPPLNSRFKADLSLWGGQNWGSEGC